MDFHLRWSLSLLWNQFANHMSQDLRPLKKYPECREKDVEEIGIVDFLRRRRVVPFLYVVLNLPDFHPTLPSIPPLHTTRHTTLQPHSS